jgi:hypothetical protein
MSNRPMYRPLIKIVAELQPDIYLPIDSYCSLNQICDIKKYLPKSLKLIGVDAKNY